MSCGVLSIFKKTAKATNSSQHIMDSTSSYPVDIPDRSSRQMISDSTPLISSESEISPTTIPRTRRGAISPITNEDQQQTRRFRSSIYLQQRPRDTSAISFPAPSSIYSRPTDAPSVASSTHSRAAILHRQRRSERVIRASQLSLFGNYSIGAPPAVPSRRRFFAALRQRLAALRRRCFLVGPGRGELSRVHRFLDVQREAVEVVERDGDDYDEVPPPRLGMDLSAASYEALVRDADLTVAEEDSAAAKVATVESEDFERRASCETTSYVSVFAREREGEVEMEARMQETEEFLFGGGWNEFGRWNDPSFLT